MNRSSALTLITPLILVLSLAACGEPEDTRPGQPVAHRRAAFKDILEVFEPMGQILQKDTLDSRTFQALARQLVAKRDAPWPYFSPDTRYPPSHAKAEVWTEAEKFAAAKKTFFEATDKLAAVAASTDKKQLEAAWAAVQDSCKSCHKAFKER